MHSSGLVFLCETLQVNDTASQGQLVPTSLIILNKGGGLPACMRRAHAPCTPTGPLSACSLAVTWRQVTAPVTVS